MRLHKMVMNTLDGNKMTEVEDRRQRKRDEVSIGWRSLRFETKGWFGNKVILNRLNGCFEYHTLNGFMGPSGAGKTTLLNCLSGNRVQGLTEDSEIFLNKDMQDGKVVSYFIEQHVQNTIMGKMQVGQILRYAYRFKNGGEGDMERHIRTIIKELLLDKKVLDRKFEQCSGGEQKRIAIAQELMSLRKPTLLFVDEPTTGLDSNAAHLVMKCLKQLATKHRMTVVTSIHVPSDDILNLFDKLYVLSKGGVCIYSGRPQQLRTYLQTEIPKLVIPKEQPPIEVLTKIACSGINDSQVSTLANKTLTAEYQNVKQHYHKLVAHRNGVPNHRKLFSIGDFCLQLGRMFRVVFIADLNQILIQLAIGIFYLIFMSTLFDLKMVKSSGCYPLALNDDNGTALTGCTNQIESDSMIRKNIFYCCNVALFIVIVVLCIGSVFNGPFIGMFRHEHRNHWYSLGTFFWSSTIVGLLQSLLYAIPFSVGGYFLSEQHYVDHYQVNWDRLGHFLFYFLILAVYFVNIGQLIGTVINRNLELALTASSFVSMTFVTYSGYVIDVEFSKNFLLILARDVLKFDKILKGIVYSIYGFERCNLDTEYSLALIYQHIERKDFEDSMLNSMRGVLVNASLIRLSTLAYMHWKFNMAGRRPGKNLDWSDQMQTIDYETPDKKTGKIDESSNNTILVTERDKSEKEVEFEKFSRGKILLAWRDLSLFGTSYLFDYPGSESGECIPQNAILKNLNGHLRFGTLNAVMGNSGAGKTSLLKVLNGRDKTRLSEASQFYLSKFTPIQTCFITQEVSGHLMPGLTAKQTLVFASRLKNAQLREFGVDTSKFNHQQIALNLLDELDLNDTVDTLVEKCSGGERKRLALALELTALQMPNLVCIDEPTSGLDSNSAEVVVSCLHKLTQTHSITIVASIHQPSTELLRMFDQIYVLARGGVCIYSGAPSSILPHLSTVSPDTKFPIETLIKLSCHSYPNPIVHQLSSTNNLHFNKSIVDSGLLQQQTQRVPEGIQQNRCRFSLEDTLILCVRYLAYFRGYLWKEFVAFLLIVLIFLIFIVNLFDSSIATITGCIDLGDDFNNSCTKTESNINEENLLVYNLQYSILAFFFFFLFVIIQSGLSFLRESVYFFNEHRNGWYSSGSFYLCKTLFETIPIFLIILVYVYFCNIYESVIPGIYRQLVLLMTITNLAFQGFSHFCCLLTGGRLLLTSMFGLTIFVMNVMLTNFTVSIPKLHYFYRLLASGNIANHLFNSLILLQYGFGRCMPKQIQPLLYLFSLEDRDLYRSLLAIFVIALGYHLISLALLIYHTNPSQNRRHQMERVTLGQADQTCAIVPGLGSPIEFRIKLNRF